MVVIEKVWPSGSIPVSDTGDARQSQIVWRVLLVEIAIPEQPAVDDSLGVDRALGLGDDRCRVRIPDGCRVGDRDRGSNPHLKDQAEDVPLARAHRTNVPDLSDRVEAAARRSSHRVAAGVQDRGGDIGQGRGDGLRDRDIGRRASPLLSSVMS